MGNPLALSARPPTMTCSRTLPRILLFLGATLLLVQLACSPRQTPTDGGTPPPPGNTPPTLDALGPVTVPEDSPPALIVLSGLGPGNEAEALVQTLSLTASTSDPSLLVQPAIERDGGTATLTLLPQPDAAGKATVTVTVSDSEGATLTREFEVTVTPINDAPSVSNPGPQQLAAGSTLVVPLEGISPGGGGDEQTQPLSLSVEASDPSLFSTLTATMLPDGRASLSMTAAASAAGPTEVTVTVDDGQSEQATASVGFSVSVLPVPPDLLSAEVGAGAHAGCVQVDFLLKDVNSLPSDVALEVDTGSGFRPATVRAGGTTNLSTSAEGVSHSVTWRSPLDLLPADLTGVRLRLRTFRGSLEGNVRTIEGLSVDNGALFAPARGFNGGPGIQQALAEDVNADGILDVLSADSTSNGFSVMTGASDGGFSSPVGWVTTPSTCGSDPAKPFSLTTGDFNSDGHPDVLVVHQFCQNVGVALSDGAGGFLPYSLHAVGQTPLFASVGDFDHDGAADVGVVNYGSNDLSVLRGAGDGGFWPQERYSTGVNPNKVEAADLDNDGWLDLVTADMAADQISIFTNAKDGGFSGASAIPAGSGPRNLAVGDLDSNGWLDVVTANPGQSNVETSVAVILQTAKGVFAPPVIYTAQVHPRSVAIRDINGDGHPDVAVGNANSSSVSVFMGNGDGTLVNARHFATGSGTHSVAWVDFDHDGRWELLTGDTYSTQFNILDNRTPVCDP